MKTYSSKSNARRAAKAAGFTTEGQDFNIVEAHTEDGSGFRFVPLNPAPAEQARVFADADNNGAGAKLLTVPAEVTVEEATVVELVVEEGAAPVAKKEVLHASTAEKPTRKVWDIADSMPGARRKEVMAACEAAGIAFFTARTQYQKWLKASREVEGMKDEYVALQPKEVQAED